MDRLSSGKHLTLKMLPKIAKYAIFPVGPTKAALTQKDITDSGGELLTLHGHSCYDFLPYRHWLGRAHSNAKFSKAAPIQVGPQHGKPQQPACCTR